MSTQEPRIGDLYRHFKGNLYQVTAIGKDATTLQKVVVYQALYGDYETYVRSYDEFVSEVDYEKYPEVTAKYRFTPVGRGGEGIRTVVSDTESEGEVQSTPSVEENEVPEPKPVMEHTVRVNHNETDDVVEKTPKKLHRRSAVSGVDPHTGISRRMLAFLDTDDMDEKYELLTDMMVEGELTDQIVDNLAASLDVVIDEGKLDDRYDQLRICIRTKAKYELQRNR